MPRGVYQRKMKDPVATFWAKVQKGDGCWTWIGNSTVNGGYGVHYVPNPRRQVRAHRYSYELHYGSFDPSLDVCHKCDNPPCVRPDHLFLGTAKDNMADCSSKGRTRGDWRAAVAGTLSKTACKNGHPYTEENTYIASRKDRPNPARHCRVCMRERRRRCYG